MSTNNSPATPDGLAEAGPDSKRSLLKFTSILAAGTLSSRVLGFLRDMVFARFFGTTAAADAFFVAFRIPNMFRELAGEGAANSAFLPVFAQYMAPEETKRRNEFLNVVFVWALIVLGLITIAGMLFTPWIVRLIAPGFVNDPQQLELTINMTRLMFPYLILIGLTAYTMAILYSYRQFVIPAFSPCLLNIVLIVGAVICTQFMKQPVYGLAVAVLIGGILQLVWQLIPLKKYGIAWSMPPTLKHEGASRIGTLLIPRMWGSVVYQASIFIDTLCASLSWIVGLGGISAIYYSSRIVQFPLGVFGMALASAVLPTLSAQAVRNDLTSLRQTLIFALRNVFFALVPSAVLIMTLSVPIVRVLFERGEFDAYSTYITAWALLFYSISIITFGGTKILVSAFHAMQDTRTPVRAAMIALGVNVVLDLVLMFPLKIGGIALAGSLAGAVNFFMLLYIMERKLGDVKSAVFPYLRKVLLLSSVMALVAMLLWNTLAIPAEWFKLGLVGGLSAAVYFGLAWIFHIEESRKLVQFAAAKLQRR